MKNLETVNGRLATLNLAPGLKTHGEELLRLRGKEYREWNPFKSKLAAAIKKGLNLKDCAIRPGATVLYLGAANGATASFVSDLVGAQGTVYCIEFSPRAMQDLLMVCEQRENMVPVLADARKPDAYAEVGKVDVLYADVADREQARIMNENSRFLKRGGQGLIAVKARCVDSAVEPKKVYGEVKRKLASHYRVKQELDLAPFEEDHLFLVLEKK